MIKIILLSTLLFPLTALSQNAIRGKVIDAETGKPLAGASLLLKGSAKGTVTANDGSFTLSLPNDSDSVSVTYSGYVVRSIGGALLAVKPVIGLSPLQNELKELTVIGSRNLSRTNVQSPVPVDVIPVANLAKEVAQTDLAQLLTYAAPSFQSARQTVSDGTDHIDPAQLRGLGSDQVLVLVNGKRRHQSALVNVNGTVNRGQVGTDLNTIPVSAIERVEVLRDGAAAQYGSDAIAGVINIVLKKGSGVLSGTVSYGENITGYAKNEALDKQKNTRSGNLNVQDGGATQVSLNYGIRLNKKGFLNLTADYLLRKASNRTGTYTGAVYPNGGGANRDDSILAARGLTRNNFDMRIGNSRIESGAFVVNAGCNLSDTWSLKAFGLVSKKKGEAAGIFRYPSAIATAAGSFAPQTLALYPDGFLPLIKTDIRDYSLSVAVDGKLGKWNASLSNTLGVNNFDFGVDHSINYTQFAVTASPQTGFDAGGLSFLQNTVNADFTRAFPVLKGLNVAYGAEFRIDRYAQRAGEEASVKNFNTASGAVAGAQVFAGFVPAYARAHLRNNVGAYLDLEQDLTKAWLLQGALRFERYSDFGSTLNYKLATRYKLSDAISVRGAASTGFRAPSLQQKFYAKTNTIFVSTPAGLVPTESGTFTNDSKPAQILGIPELKEETSRNYSAGFTATPFKGFEVSVDGYLIKIKNRIILTNNFSGGNNAALTQLLKDNGATTANFFTNAIDTKAKGIEGVLSYRTGFARINKLKFSLAATFIKNDVEKGTDGKALIKASDVLIASGQIGSYFNREDESRLEVASPASKGSFSINYNRKKLGLMVRLAYFGKVTYLDPTINPDSTQKFPVNAFTGAKETLDQTFAAKTVTDVSVSYQPTKYFTLTAGSNNVFDVYQDKHTHSGNVSLGRFIYSRRVEQMGFNGRAVFARLSFNIAAQKEGR